MKKTIFTFCVCLLAVSTAQAGTVTSILDIPVDGNYAAGAFPFISTSQNVSGATFDINYTLSANSPDSGALVGVLNQQIGVGSDNDINSAHFNTLEGDGSAGANGSTAGPEGLSFTGLSITNFLSNGSGLVLADITNLQFNEVTVTAVANRFDNAAISYQGFELVSDPGSTAVRQSLASGATGGTPFDIPLTTLANFDPLATDLYIQPDSAAGGNRWAVTGLSVTFDTPTAVPEPSSLSILGFGFIGLLARRRR